MNILPFAIFVAVLGPGMALPASASDLLDPEAAFRFSVRLLSPSTVEVHYDVADGYYLYRDKFRFSFSPGDIKPGSVEFPRGMMKLDPIFGKVETYRKSVTIRFPVPEIREESVINLVAISQGCADVGVCYPPMTSRAVLGEGSGGGTRDKSISSLFGRKSDER